MPLSKKFIASCLLILASSLSTLNLFSEDSSTGFDVPSDIIKRILSQVDASPAYIPKPIPTGKSAYTGKKYNEDYQAWWRGFWKRNLNSFGLKDGSEAYKLAIKVIDSTWVDNGTFHATLTEIREQKNQNAFFNYINGWVPSSSSTGDAKKVLQASLTQIDKAKADPIAKILVMQAILSRDRQFYNEKFRDKMQLAFLASAKSRSDSDSFRLKFWIKNADDYGIINAKNRKALEHLIKGSGIHPYLKGIAEGELYTDKAWEIRGSGWAYQVTEKGWEGFFHNITLAKTALTKAYEMNPELWPAPYQLITIAGTHGGIGTPRMWFDRTVASYVELRKAYNSLFWFTMPRWGGSHAAIESFAKECWETKAFETEVPYMFLEKHRFISKDYSHYGEYLSKKQVFEEAEKFFEESHSNPRAKRNKEYASGYLSAMALSGHRWDDHQKYRQKLKDQKTPFKLLKRFNLTQDNEVFAGSESFRNAAGKDKEILTLLALADYDRAISEGDEWMMSSQDDKEIFVMLMNSLVRMPFKKGQEIRNTKLMKVLLYYQMDELALRKFRYFITWQGKGEKDRSVDVLGEMLETRFSKFEVDAIRGLPRTRPLSPSQYLNEEKRIKEAFAKEKGLPKETLNLSLLRVYALEDGTPFGKKIAFNKNLIKKISSKGKLNEVCFAWSVWYYNTQQIISLIHSAYRTKFQWLNHKPQVVHSFINSEEKNNAQSFREFFIKEGEPTVAFTLESLSGDKPWANLAWRYAWSTRRWFKEYARVYNYSAEGTYSGLQAHLKAEGQLDHALFFAEKHFQGVTYNSGALLCAYVFHHHGMKEKAKQALKKASALKKDRGGLFLPGMSFKNTKELEIHLKSLITGN